MVHLSIWRAWNWCSAFQFRGSILVQMCPQAQQCRNVSVTVNCNCTQIFKCHHWVIQLCPDSTSELPNCAWSFKCFSSSSVARCPSVSNSSVPEYPNWCPNMKVPTDFQLNSDVQKIYGSTNVVILRVYSGVLWKETKEVFLPRNKVWIQLLRTCFTRCKCKWIGELACAHRN